MEKRIEKWESLRLEAQEFVPQEYIAGCEESATYYIKTDLYTCSDANMSCTKNETSLTNHIIEGLHFGAKTITLDADMVGTVRTALTNAPGFYINCGGTITGPYKVLCAPDMHATNITSSTWGAGHLWHIAECDMDKGPDIVPGAVAAISEGWDIVKNHS